MPIKHIKVGIFLLTLLVASSILPSAYAIDIDDYRLVDRTLPYIPEAIDIQLYKEKRVHFKFDIKGTFNDNIYLTKENTKADFITAVSPSISTGFGSSNHMVYANYKANYTRYSFYPKENSLGHSFTGRAELFRNSKFKFSFSDTITPSTILSNEEQKNVDQINNNFQANVRYDTGGKLSFGLSYSNTWQLYRSIGLEDSSHMTHTTSPTIYWHLSPKTSLTCEYNYSFIDYYRLSRLNDAEVHQVRCGIQGRLTPKSTIYFKAGYQYRKPRIGDISSEGDAYSSSFELMYDYNYSPKTSFSILGSQAMTETLYGTGFIKTLYIKPSMVYHITHNFDFTLGVSYIRIDYPFITDEDESEESRLDHTGGVTIGYNYRIKNWLTANITYAHMRRYSRDQKDNNFINNKLMLGCNIAF